MSSLQQRFATLRWRLTLSYVVTAFVALVALEGAFVIVSDLVALNAPLRPLSLLQGLQHLAPQAATFLGQTPTDQAGLADWLKAHKDPMLFSDTDLAANNTRNFTVTPGGNSLLAVVDSAGQVIATREPTVKDAGHLTGLLNQPAAHAVIAAALAHRTGAADLLSSTPDRRTVIAAPIIASDGKVLGALLLGVDLPALQSGVIRSDLLTLLFSFVPFAIIASILGTLFGLLTARGLTRRLRRLTTAAEAWSRGDFAAEARDPSLDELGQLARDLNRMAEQLQTLLHSRQQLAVVEERQRLARDLHDSIKQQVFATAMQVAAARALVPRDPVAADQRLGEVERMMGEAQRELTTLIQELRPAALANKGLGPAVREFAEDWSRRADIPVEIRMQGEQPAPLEIEQALFRVTQEALANVARHSAATKAEVQIRWEAGALLLAITDNGVGFDVDAAAGKGVGLQSMQERMTALGGTLAMRRAGAGTGMCVEVCVPLVAVSTSASNGASG